MIAYRGDAEEFRHQAVEKALHNGIRPTARMLMVSRSSLKRWIKAYKKDGPAGLMKYHRHHRRLSPELEGFIVSLKEKDPRYTLKQVRSIVKARKGRELSLKCIYRILERYGMTDRSYLPLVGAVSAENRDGLKRCQMLLEQRKLAEAAELVNSLPALPDFSILKKIPANLLSIRRQAEQLDFLWDFMPLEEACWKLRELRRLCESKKHYFTAIAVASLEIVALHFLGYSNKVLSLYAKYEKYLPNLPSALKYKFLLSVHPSFVFSPEQYPAGVFRRLPVNVERYCMKLPPGIHRIYWFDAASACYQMRGNTHRSLHWMKRLLREVPAASRKTYLPEYFSLMATKGEYDSILDFEESLEGIATIPSLRILLSRANALLLGMGRPNEALEMALNGFYRVRKEHLLATMSGFAFFIACAYSALKETRKAKQYLGMSLHFSKNIERQKMLFSMLLGHAPVMSACRDKVINLVSLYLSACKTLRHTDYKKAYRFAARNGFLGFLHRIILIHPEPVLMLLKKGKATYLRKALLELPVFREDLPVFTVALLGEQDSIFYGNRRIAISRRSKDFDLLTYLFLNRKKNLYKDGIIEIFYKNTLDPLACLNKALSRIRTHLGLPKGALVSKKDGVFFSTEARIDLETFEERYKLGRISEKVEQMPQALNEYRLCYALYKKSPFERMGYSYNFAEEKRTAVRAMFSEVSNYLLSHAREKSDLKMVHKIEKKLQDENLLPQN